MRTSTITSRQASAQLTAYLQLLTAGQHAGRFLEIRHSNRHATMSRLFIPVQQTDTAARTIAAIATRADVYCGVLLRIRHAGDRDAVAPAHLVWAEIDQPDALTRLAKFEHAPTMIIRSGTPGHAHAYWHLHQPASIPELEQANRRLAHYLGADLAAVDAARILRPCGTQNHKHQPPTAVTLATHQPTRRYPLTELVAGLKDPRTPPAPASRDRRTVLNELDAQLLAIPAATYVGRLTGRQPTRAGKVNCPFHEDRTPSLQLYQDGSWYCFGCQHGGSIYDFAALLWAQSTKGRQFVALRSRLAFQLIAPAG